MLKPKAGSKNIFVAFSYFNHVNPWNQVHYKLEYYDHDYDRVNY